MFQRKGVEGRSCCFVVVVDDVALVVADANMLLLLSLSLSLRFVFLRFVSYCLVLLRFASFRSGPFRFFEFLLVSFVIHHNHFALKKSPPGNISLVCFFQFFCKNNANISFWAQRG